MGVKCKMQKKKPFEWPGIEIKNVFMLRTCTTSRFHPTALPPVHLSRNRTYTYYAIIPLHLLPYHPHRSDSITYTSVSVRRKHTYEQRTLVIIIIIRAEERACALIRTAAIFRRTQTDTHARAQFSGVI